MAIKYHLYDESYGKKSTRHFPVEELDALVTEAEREEYPLAGWKQVLLDAIKEPPEGRRQYVIIRCGYVTCTGNGERHLGLSEEYFLPRYIQTTPAGDEERAYAEKHGLSKTCAYHCATVDTRIDKHMRRSPRSGRKKDVLYSNVRTMEDWWMVIDYVADVEEIDQITIMACAMSGCTDITRHTRFAEYFIPVMRKAVRQDKHGDWMDG